jgi:hypothetical protein
MFPLLCSVGAGSLPALRRTQSGRVVNLPSHHPEAEQFDGYAALGPAPSARGSVRVSSGSFSAGRSAGGPVIAITNATDVPSPPPSHFTPDDPFEMGFEQVDRESKMVCIHAVLPVIMLGLTARLCERFRAEDGMLSPYALVRMHALKCLACRAPVLFAHAFGPCHMEETYGTSGIACASSASAHSHRRRVFVCV